MTARPTVLLLIVFLTQVCNWAPAQELSSQSLLDFVNTRYQAYFHYNICTFKNAASDQHFGRSTGREPPSMWNPTGLDCEQWARVCKENRLAGGWLTTKHRGGFGLWDSRYTDYDVASSPVKTDVVRAFVDAFRAAGLKVGLYYSVLDYHHGEENGQVTREEFEFLKAQVRELLTDNGPIDYMNFDGWPTVPDFDDIPYAELFNAVKSVQPDCLIVNHCYESNLAHADIPFADAAGRKYPFHPEYLRPIAASDVLQRDWWWDDNDGYGTVRRSVDYVLSQLDSYNTHHAVYVLNIAPQTTGRIPEDAIQRLEEIAEAWKRPPDVPRAGPNWGYQYAVAGNLAFLRPAGTFISNGRSRAPFAWPKLS